MLHFQKMTGHNGPSCDGRRWVDDQPDLYDHRQQVQWFARFLQYACRDASEQLNVRQRRLPSHVLTFWAGHIQVGFTSEELLKQTHSFSITLPDCRPDRFAETWPMCPWLVNITSRLTHEQPTPCSERQLLEKVKKVKGFDSYPYLSHYVERSTPLIFHWKDEEMSSHLSRPCCCLRGVG